MEPSTDFQGGPLDTQRMQYRSRPVSVTVDPISLVISECISITSAIQKHARSPHLSVSAILGGNPNTLQFGTASLRPQSRSRSPQGNPEKIQDVDTTVNNRWALRGQKGKNVQDNPMMTGFGKLRHEIAGVRDIKAFDAPTLLAPFLLVIQTKGTAAPVTILALSALRKFLAYGFVSSYSPRFALAMQSLSAAVTHCQFDISDSAQGEVVLLMILNLMEDMMSGPGGYILSDESVCDMMGRGLAICSQPRFSPVLRRTAEAVMVKMCQIIFEDVKHIEIEKRHGIVTVNHGVDSDVDHIKAEALTADASSFLISGHMDKSDYSTLHSPDVLQIGTPNHQTTRARQSDDGRETDTESLDLNPYSLPSVKELFRVLVNFLDPGDRQHTDTMRVMALRIIHVALEVSGPFIARHPALAKIAGDRLCCYLFQLVRSDNMAILQESLIVAGTLLSTCREVLKLQQELFLSYLVACLHPTVHIPREPGIDPSLYSGIPETPKLVKPPPSQANSGRSTPIPVKDRQKLGLEGGARKPDARQAMVEAIGVLSRMPTFAAELFINYDCDEDRADLCEDMIGLLSRNALPDSAAWSTTSVPPLCLDALLRFIQFVADRLHDKPSHYGYPDPTQLRERRRRKKIIVKGTGKFNEKPKAGLEYLESNGIIADSRDPKLVAKFLKGTSRISKAVLGDFLSKRGNESILDAFLDLFDFSGKRIDQALRLLLETFRLPGEAPLIASIVESFSEKYCACGHLDEVANTDAVFILTYAIILLNTDQHNPNLKPSKRMTFEDFSRNLRGQNNGQDFSVNYLREIFECIKSDEIILPDEHDNQHAFDYAWRELLLKSGTVGNLLICDTNIYDADMFAATWKPIVSTLSYVFMSATDEAVFARVVTGFDECARIAAKYKNTEALDHIVYCLSYMTTLASDLPFSTTLNTEVQAGDGSVMVSELAVKLGRDFRAQLATLVLFHVVTGNESLMTQSWKYVIRTWVHLFINSLIPPFSSARLPSLPIPSIPLQTPSQVIDRGSRSADGGFFSAFTTYISSYAADDPPEPSEEELESTLCTVDCIQSCNMSKIFDNIAGLSTACVDTLVQSMLDQLPEDEHPAVITVKHDGNASTTVNGPTLLPTPAHYDPSVPYLLEFCTILAIRDGEVVTATAKRVLDAIYRPLRDPGRWHAITVSRAAFYGLAILKASYDVDLVNVPIFLHTISSLPRDLLLAAAQTVLTGLANCTNEPGPLRSEIMTSPDFWVTLDVLARNLDTASLVFEILQRGMTGNPPAIIADNYEAAVKLLDHFASVASLQDGHSHESNGLEGDDKFDHEVVSRGCEAVNTLYGLTNRIPQFMQQSHLGNSEGSSAFINNDLSSIVDMSLAWSAYWLPLFQALLTQCTNSCRDVRQLAFSAVQRSLLSPNLISSDPSEWTAIFSKILFPLITQLLKPEVFSYDKDGMSEMRVQAASLLCKVFLQYMVLLSKWDGMLDLWIRIIEMMDRLMNSGQGDSLEEAVRENLKNVVLFMVSSGYLVSPEEDPSTQNLWDETWTRVDRFLPDLRRDIIEEAQKEASVVKVPEDV